MGIWIQVLRGSVSYFPELDELVEQCPDDMKLAVTRWVFQNISKHMEEGGSFRYLIYNRMGFTGKAYTPLYDGGGLDISNFCNDVREFDDGRGSDEQV